MRSSLGFFVTAYFFACFAEPLAAQQAVLGGPQPLSQASPASPADPSSRARLASFPLSTRLPQPQFQSQPREMLRTSGPTAVPEPSDGFTHGDGVMAGDGFPSGGGGMAGGFAAEGCGFAAEGCCQSGCQTCLRGVDCAWQTGGQEGRWTDLQPMDFQRFGQGEYAGPARLSHLAEYRLRPGDQLQVIYLLTRRQISGSYRLMVGDEVLIESVADDELTRGTFENGLKIQPDGTITVRLLGQIQAAGLTITQLRELLEQRYIRYYPQPAVDVTPIRTNTLAEDIRNAVGGASGLQQQAISVTVTPDGTIRLPVIGAVRVQGFSLDEVKREVNLAYGERVVGLEVEPILTQQAPHFVFVIGEVGTPSRIELNGPTTVTGGIASAGGWLPGANLRQVVIFRRAEDWRIVSTMLDLRGALLGKRPTPSDEIWLRDGDVVVVPPAPIRMFDHFVRQVFTEGVYGIVPFSGFGIALGDGRF